MIGLTIATVVLLSVAAAVAAAAPLAGLGIALGTVLGAVPGFAVVAIQRSRLGRTVMNGPNLVMAATGLRMVLVMAAAAVAVLMVPRVDLPRLLVPLVLAYLVLLVVDSIAMVRSMTTSDVGNAGEGVESGPDGSPAADRR